jgi:hypothetical protein
MSAEDMRRFGVQDIALAPEHEGDVLEQVRDALDMRFIEVPRDIDAPHACSSAT